MKKYIVSLFVLVLLFTSASLAHASLLDDLTAKIGQLFTNVQSVQNALPADAFNALNDSVQSVRDTAATLKNQTTTPALRFTFASNLKVGSRGTEVVHLQTLLKENGYYNGVVSGTYDSATAASVKSFQEDNNISPVGYTGPKTDAALTATAQQPGICALANGQPVIKVKNPNGGEVYKTGQQITVKWRTCNIPADAVMSVSVFSPSITGTAVLAPNTGTVVYTLADYNLPPGTQYKVSIGLGVTTPIKDESDDFFTINSSQTTTACGAANPPSVTVLSPNGGEVYMVGQQITVTWETCNVPANEPIDVEVANMVIHKAFSITPTTNTGTLALTLPSKEVLDNAGAPLGNNFKVSVSTGEGTSLPKIVYDYSNQNIAINVSNTDNCTINSFTANPSVINSGTSSHINGESNCAHIAVFKGAVTQGTSLNFETGPLNEATTYTAFGANSFYIGCTTLYGYSTIDGQPCTKNAVSKTVTVTVGGTTSSCNIDSFYGDPSTVEYGKTSVLHYNLNQSCRRYSIPELNYSSLGVGGYQQIGPLYKTTQYTITASSNEGCGGTIYSTTDGKKCDYTTKTTTITVQSQTAICSAAGTQDVIEDALGYSSPVAGSFEGLHLDISSHPEILKYKIQWFNGTWSDWYVPGTNDQDWKTNTDGTSRRVWSYFDDHKHEYVKKCL